jgi:hypothetical protein
MENDNEELIPNNCNINNINFNRNVCQILGILKILLTASGNFL